jgi:hypothetical protein
MCILFYYICSYCSSDTRILTKVGVIQFWSRVLLILTTRASYFSYISSVSYVVAFMGPSLASFTMSQSLWLPFWINIALLLAAIPTIYLLPETKSHPSKYYPELDPAAPEADPLLGQRPSSPIRCSNAFEVHKRPSNRIIQTIMTLIRLIIGRRNFQLLLASFLLTALASSDTKLLVQYISKRYKWTFAQVNKFPLLI